MRILITGPSFADPGGVAAYYSAVLPHLRRVLPDVHYLEIGSTRHSGNIFHPLIDQLRFRAELRRLRPTLVLCNPSLDLKSFLRDGMFVLQAALSGTPVLVFFRGWDKDFERRVERSWRWYFNWTYRRAQAFIVLASEFRARLTDWGVSAPIHLGTTAVADELMQGFSIEQKWSQQRPDDVVRLLFLARLERSKGIFEVLDALSLLHEKGLRVTLTIAGDGRAMGEVRQFAAAHPELSAAITIVGDVRGDRKRELLASHDIYCFPSYTEGMPNSVLEAMAFGLPVITAAVGGLVDIFEDGQMGYLLTRITAQDVAAAVEKLAGDATLRRSIAEFNHRHARANFLASAAAGRLHTVIGKVNTAQLPALRAARPTLITGPSLGADPGGVAAYYNAVLPHLRQMLGVVHYLEIGSTRRCGGIFHPLVDQLRLYAALRRLRPSMVLCNPSLDLKSFLRDGLFALQAALSGTPVLVFFHGWDKAFERRVQRSWRWYFNRTYRRAQAFIVLASEFRSKLTDWGIVAPIHLGTTVVADEIIQGFSIERKWSQHRPDDVVRLLFLARLERTKGIRETLGALALLRAKGLAVTLTVAGDGRAMGEVRKFAAAHPELSAALSIVGDVRGERKRELLANHDIYCFPSYTEGMPNSVLEAMAFGLPVVTAAVGGLADFFEDGRMGCLLHSITAEEVAAATEKLIGNPTLLRSISEFNHRRALANFLAAPAAARLSAWCQLRPVPELST
jgi:glycosyltransferase involved in cell wall biosynthesis